MINKLLNSIFIGQPKVSDNILMYPLYHNQNNFGKAFKPLKKAVEDGSVIISEKEPSPDVNELVLENLDNEPVFIMDGEYLFGAKQDRTVNLSVLVPGNTIINLPVSCVEAGRWSAPRKNSFNSYDKLHFAKAKAARHASVSRSLNELNIAESNQREVWDDIRRKEATMRQHSQTHSMKSLYQCNERKLDIISKTLNADDKQIGSLFCLNNEVIGFDIFSSPDLHKFYSPMITKSVAIDSLEMPGKLEKPPREMLKEAQRFLDAVKGLGEKKFDSVGLGSVFRGFSKYITASSLVFKETDIHACAFLIDNKKAIGR